MTLIHVTLTLVTFRALVTLTPMTLTRHEHCMLLDMYDTNTYDTRDTCHKCHTDSCDTDDS